MSGFYSKTLHIYAIIGKVIGYLSKRDIYPNQYIRRKSHYEKAVANRRK